MMSGPPLRLMINKEVTPVAHHSPIPVPLNWQEEVKAALDADVRLGVLEKVPVGNPVTWCHRMVVCAKKNGKPRRTVDFQSLNIHAARETHHSPSPFHQARGVPEGQRKRFFSMRGMGITVYGSTKMINISRLSSLLGDVTAIAWPLKDTARPETVTLADMTK